MSERPTATELSMTVRADELEGYGGVSEAPASAERYLRDVWGIACAVYKVDTWQDTAEVGSFDEYERRMGVGPPLAEIWAVQARPVSPEVPS